jgi:hypothetical protein
MCAATSGIIAALAIYRTGAAEARAALAEA